MWTNVTLTVVEVWDDLHWWVTATWQDSAEAEPVVLGKSGVCPRRDAEAPTALLRAGLRALEEALQHASWLEAEE